jgi:hypothetical protein
LVSRYFTYTRSLMRYSAPVTRLTTYFSGPRYCAQF